ncbi:linker for activation of T-cells family member 2 isoform X4 [Tyto alba]|uniref:linker for activation of T-cells family member 2 isoform X4 n=1 Tax=Tyto alba TaxID=56313 RepID=UPI001C678AE8|nr:linker for activation of T-cells family member 2 isoform X4 [Tyto alba]
MAQLELLWAAAALMLFGAAVSLCVKCQLSATKREKHPSERRSQLESQQRFEVIRSHSMLATTRRLEQIKEHENLSIARKTTKELGTSRRSGYGSGTECRYQNFLTGSPYLWITTTVPGSSHHPTRKRRIPIPIKMSSLKCLTALIQSQMMLQTTRTAQQYTYGNSSRRKLCRQKAPMTSQTTSTRPLHQVLPLLQSKAGASRVMP